MGKAASKAACRPSGVCLQEGVSLIPYSPLAGGVLSGKYQDGARPDGARFSNYLKIGGRQAVMAQRFVNDKSLASTARFAAIAAEAGVGPASVYRYFADVDEIVDVLLTEHADASAQAVHTALTTTASRTVGGVFEAVLRAFLHLYATRPEFTVMWRSPVLADRQRRHDQAADRAIAGEIARHLVAIGTITADTTEIRDRLAAHFDTAGALLGAILRANPTTKPILEADLLALVRHLEPSPIGEHPPGISGTRATLRGARAPRGASGGMP
eukprot:gene14785-31422_t